MDGLGRDWIPKCITLYEAWKLFGLLSTRPCWSKQRNKVRRLVLRVLLSPPPFPARLHETVVSLLQRHRLQILSAIPSPRRLSKNLFYSISYLPHPLQCPRLLRVPLLRVALIFLDKTQKSAEAYPEFAAALERERQFEMRNCSVRWRIRLNVLWLKRKRRNRGSFFYLGFYRLAFHASQASLETGIIISHVDWLFVLHKLQGNGYYHPHASQAPRKQGYF